MSPHTWYATPGAGERLKAWREQRRVTQAELSEYLGVTKRAVQYWESGLRPITHEQILRMALDHYDCLHGTRVGF